LGGACGILIGDAHDVHERQIAQRPQMMIGHVTGSYDGGANPPIGLGGIGMRPARFQPAGLNLLGMFLVG
jgi:hypothetical protein